MLHFQSIYGREPDRRREISHMSEGLGTSLSHSYVYKCIEAFLSGIFIFFLFLPLIFLYYIPLSCTL